jgi:tetratricopeptide (TPR) repeat protein
MAEKRIAILKRANKLFRQGKADAAVKEYKKILGIKPDDLEVRRIIGDLELRQSNVGGAIEQFEWIGDYYLKEGFFAKAIAMYKRISRVDPGYEGALYKLADLYTKQGLVMEAKQIYLDIAEECKRQGNQKKALDMYKKILEFDRSNIKMRLLLADNYLKEGLEQNAVNEYLTAADILINKKDFRRVEELITSTLSKIKNVKLIEKLIYLYTQEGEEDKAINMLKDLGLDVFKNVDLLKAMGELYLKKNLISEAEIVFSKIAEIDPEETEVIMRLGKVYMQREEYDKTYNLFLPIIEKNIQNGKYEEAASMLRFIIASNNTYLPALNKLAAIFKISGKTNNLIALYESMIPIHEQQNNKEELKQVLEELIQLSETPFSYEEHLARLTGPQAPDIEGLKEDEKEADIEDEREKEFINYNLRIVEESLKVSDFNKAVSILKKSKTAFPKNTQVREKLFALYQQMDQVEMAVEEGKGLLELYRYLDRSGEYSDLLERLSVLKPEDERLVSLSGDEKTSIDLDVDKYELAEEISDHEMDEGEMEESDVLVLSQDQSVAVDMDGAPLIAGEAPSKSLSSVLSEVDFYVNDGYFGDAEKLIDDLKKKYPGNKQLLEKIQKLERAKKEARKKGESASASTGIGFEIERSGVEEANRGERVKESKHINTELLSKKEAMIHQGADSNIEIEIDMDELGMETPGKPGFPGLKLTDSSSVPAYPPFELELEQPAPAQISDREKEHEYKSKSESDIEDVFELEPSMSHSAGRSPFQEEIPSRPGTSPEDSSMLKISEEAYAATDHLSLGDEMDEEPLELSVEESLIEIEPSIAEESSMAQKYEDSKLGINIDAREISPGAKARAESIPTPGQSEFELELEGAEDISEVPMMEVDKDLLIQSPSVSPDAREKSADSYTSSVLDEIDLDSIIKDEEASESEYADEPDSPFKEIVGADLMFEDSEEDLLKEEVIFLDEAYMEVEKNIEGEQEAIMFWLKELEKQRTSTIEKNMMEIFEEFKKGVDEKIGKEDYDTRYNLGIAYKEMGLLEEAIHEFLISSKHPSKFFDSAGLLGMCFREKGMFTEAITWFEKAMDTPGRREEEYLAVRYEMVITLKLREDYPKAKKILEDIIKITPNYRNVAQLYQEINTLAGT